MSVVEVLLFFVIGYIIKGPHKTSVRVYEYVTGRDLCISRKTVETLLGVTC